MFEYELKDSEWLHTFNHRFKKRYAKAKDGCALFTYNGTYVFGQEGFLIPVTSLRAVVSVGAFDVVVFDSKNQNEIKDFNLDFNCYLEDDWAEFTIYKGGNLIATSERHSGLVQGCLFAVLFDEDLDRYYTVYIQLYSSEQANYSTCHFIDGNNRWTSIYSCTSKIILDGHLKAFPDLGGGLNIDAQRERIPQVSGYIDNQEQC